MTLRETYPAARRVKDVVHTHLRARAVGGRHIEMDPYLVALPIHIRARVSEVAQERLRRAVAALHVPPDVTLTVHRLHLDDVRRQRRRREGPEQRRGACL